MPPGQHEIEHFPRFGAPPFDTRFPREPERLEIQISGDVRDPITVRDELAQLSRVQQRSDFHCVTTWTRRSLEWGGFRFSDFYQQLFSLLLLCIQ